VIVAGVAAYFTLQRLQHKELPDGFASSNGRIEAVEIDVATKTPGRLEAVLVGEGDFVVAGQVLAQMDTKVLIAQLREAKAELRRSQTAIETAKSGVAQRESEKSVAESVVLQREAEFDLASKNYSRSETAEERQKLTFRIKAHIPPEVLKNYVREVKTGLPGVAYVQLDPQAPWPGDLAVRLPE